MTHDPGLTLEEQRELLELVRDTQSRVDRLLARLDQLQSEREKLLLRLAMSARASA